LVGSERNDTISGSYSHDLLQGLAGNDLLQGDYGNDILVGADGADILKGSFGHDSLQGDAGNDLLLGGAGDDTLAGEEDSDQLEGNTGDDLLQGSKGNDFLDGGEGNDSLQGSTDNDWLVGGAGNDVINGGDGQDAMRGDSGADLFVIEKPASIPDLILDFNPSEGDRLILDKTGFNTDKLTADFKFLGGYLYYKEEKIALLQKDGETYNYFADLSEILEFAETNTLASVPVTPTNTDIPTTRSFIPPQTRSNTATGENMLEDILQRGYLKVGVIPGRAGFTLEKNGEWSGYGVDWARGLSVALFGNPDQVEFLASETTTFQEIIDKVAAKEVDIVSTNLNPYLTWDASLGVDFSPTTIYDARSLMVRQGEGIDTLSDLHGKKIALTSNTPGAQAFQDYMAKNNIEFQPVFFNTINETFEAYFNGLVDAIPAERTSLIGQVRQQSNLGEHLILDEELSKDPISLVLPENESAWADVVRWVVHAPVQAEEFGINSQNIEEFKTSNDPAIRRFLGLEGELGATLGLTNPTFAADVIKTVGNYGEMFDRHFSNLRRNRNEIWTNDGLLYSPPFAGAMNNPLPFVDNDQRDLLQDVLKRGTVKVGVSGVNPGFSLNKGEEWSGIDVDLGRALAAALFGDPEQIEFVKQDNLPTALVNVANGAVDLSAMGATQNLVRDAGMQVDFGPTYLYTGQGILVRKDSGITSLPMLNGRKIGILSGTTAEQNLSDALVRTGGDFIPVEYATGAELLEAYDKGVIDAISWDIAILNANLSE
ncbi:MAG: transporter substrate-binding domain-containing protein, partial [Microcoleaceae cyanobacterium]